MEWVGSRVGAWSGWAVGWAVGWLLVFDRLGPFLFSMVAWRTFFCFLWRLGGLFVVLAAGFLEDYLLLVGHV